MNNLYLKNNPLLFQGEKHLKRNNNYFEGWYFKNSLNNFTVSFIPGINIKDNNKSCFIQIITNVDSYYITYNFNDFTFSHKPFFIKIKNNYFSEDKIIIDINETNLKISSTLHFSGNIKLAKKFISPNVMGPFSYIPNMECNHALLSLHHYINGSFKINNSLYTFNNGIGYIEKDWGTSFPQSYIWCQGNHFFNNSSASFFLSIASIPFKLFSFIGFICVFYLNEKEYRFTTYNGSKIEYYKIVDNYINITLSNNKYKIIITANNNNFSKLLAPKNGNMCTHVSESVDSEIYITLLEKGNIIFNGSSINCGIEINNFNKLK